MKTYLLVWNPKKWTWTNLESDIEEVNNTGRCSENWSCGRNKSIEVGDRIFLIKVGTEPKGIIGAGFAASTPYAGKHWSGENRETFYIDIEYEALLNPEKEPILTLDLLELGNLAKQHWLPQTSGISIRPELVDELEALWFDFLTTANIRHNPFTETNSVFSEDSSDMAILAKYERNPYARKVSLEQKGYTCSSCGLDFTQHYGDNANHYIQVHDKRQTGEVFDINPVKDLTPICPKCHRMLH
jgi:5-methylcytosine-specific restriction protein A